MDLMGDSADTLFEGVYVGCHGYWCWETVPLYYCPRNEALLDVFLRFKGYIVSQRMCVTWSSLQVFKIVCDVQGYEYEYIVYIITSFMDVYLKLNEIYHLSKDYEVLCYGW